MPGNKKTDDDDISRDEYDELRDDVSTLQEGQTRIEKKLDAYERRGLERHTAIMLALEGPGLDVDPDSEGGVIDQVRRNTQYRRNSTKRTWAFVMAVAMMGLTAVWNLITTGKVK